MPIVNIRQAKTHPSLLTADRTIAEYPGPIEFAVGYRILAFCVLPRHLCRINPTGA